MSLWFKRPINIVVTILAAFIFVTAATLIILKVSTRNLDEEAPALMVCWEDGEAHYLEEGEEFSNDTETTCSAERAQELVWARDEIPLAIATVSPIGQELAEDSDGVRVVKATISDLNSQVGCELAKAIPRNDPVGATIYWGTAIEVGGAETQNAPGSCAHRGTGAPIEGAIRIRGGLSDRAAYLVLLHELGHLYGLGHNDFRGSVMYPFVIDDTEADLMSGGRLSDGSIARLRRNYCPQ